ncbi:uncharacterized protein LOC122378054 [Amphibalanus amphitrite]|uniref:uncharacterized protein LOC122378054 n=1 Tax=Amphibalanus amphitrite TaxID=1232801 RepID=UPI001C8FB00A|nr:uncharacterized protein LOC122378054 [Amphibalanus amphitrite]
MASQPGMNRDVFKPSNTLERTPPGSPSVEEKDKSQADTSKNGELNRAKAQTETRTDNVGQALNETQELDSDDDDQDVEGQGGSRVKRLDSNVYKPFGSRSSSGTSQPSHDICRGGPGRRKGSKKKCGLKVEDNQDGVCCDGCKFWFHLDCQKVQSETYKALQETKGVFWLCSECRAILPELARRAITMGEEKEESQPKADKKENVQEDNQAIISAIKAQKQEILAAMKQQEKVIITSIKETQPAKTYAEAAKKIEDQVGKLQSAMKGTAEMSEAVNVIKQKSEEQSDKLKGMEESVVRQMAQQSQVLESNTTNIEKVVRLKEKENRAQNLIFHNIDESKPANVEERKDHDEQQFKEMMKKLMGENRSFKTEKIIRLGKKDETTKKNRLMLVRLSSREEAEEIYKNRMRMRGKYRKQIHIPG